MSVSIRLSLLGKKNHPFYRIVACTTRSKRDGQYLDILGTYDPGVKPPVLNLNHGKLEEWIKKGALISDGVRKLLKQ